MSQTREIGNEEPLFQFDSYEGPADAGTLEDLSHLTRLDLSRVHCISPFSLSSPDLLSHSANPREMDERHPFTLPEPGKGKGVSRPLAIRTQTRISTSHDSFDVGSSSSGRYFDRASASYRPSSPLTSTSFDLPSIQTPLDDICHRFMVAGLDNPMQIQGPSFSDESQVASGSLPGKGKARELAPVLPPLEFSPTDFGYGDADWPSPGRITPTLGPSSYGSVYGSVIESNVKPATGNGNYDSPQSPHIPRRMPSRRRSLSNLSIHSTLSKSQIKVKFGATKGPGNLARKLLMNRTSSSYSSPSHTPGTITPGGNVFDEDFTVGQGSCLMPWRNDFKQNKDVTPVPFVNLEAKFDQHALPIYHRGQTYDLKGKSRSYSSPLPLSALDIVPTAPIHVFKPIPIIPRNYFDEILPRELRLRVLCSLVMLHEEEHGRLMRDDEWTVSQASSLKSKWIGRDKGARELVKFSRVSKSWQGLVFDGQMWSNLDLRAFPQMHASLLIRLSKTAGTFVKAIDVSGHASLLPSTLVDVVDYLCLKPGLLPHTQLTTINFQGCLALTTDSLRHLLLHSPSLQTICLKGLTAVNNTVCRDIGVNCSQVTSLDISRCMNVDGEGVRLLILPSLKGDPALLKELRASGLKRINDEVLATLGKGAPFLEVLDLSYVRDLHNSALEAFVSCSDDYTRFETVLLTSRQAGRDSNDPTKYRRRVTRLRHLSISSCVLLTDIACSNLAHTMPQLELLEMAGIGGELKDDGLVRLLSTTPLIRKLDLEDASEITDTLLAAITPGSVADGRSRGANEPLEPGHALEHLGISYAANVTDQAFTSLIRKCSRLTVLEADNTHISGSVLREFVQLARKRKIVDPIIVVIDCRGVGESLVKELSPSTRPRKGWKSYDARKLGYVDGSDKEDLKVGRDECDDKRVVLKSFYSWQTVDAVRAAREKRKKARRVANASNGSTDDLDDFFSSSGRARWWSPTGRRTLVTVPPTMADTDNDRDQCRIM